MSLREPIWWRLSRITTVGSSISHSSVLHCSARLERYCRRSCFEQSTSVLHIWKLFHRLISQKCVSLWCFRNIALCLSILTTIDEWCKLRAGLYVGSANMGGIFRKPLLKLIFLQFYLLPLVKMNASQNGNTYLAGFLVHVEARQVSVGYLSTSLGDDVVC